MKIYMDVCCLNRPFDDQYQDRIRVEALSMITKDPNAIRKAGIEFLTKGLGPVGMAYFLRQYDMGEGNYTKERKELLKDITLEDIKREIE